MTMQHCHLSDTPHDGARHRVSCSMTATARRYCPTSGAILPARAWPGRPGVECAEQVIDLNGTWSFSTHRQDPDPLIDPSLPAAQPELLAHAQTMAVPSHWVLPPGRYGEPAYTNMDFPFPITPPFPPDDNPTADYWRTFDLDADVLAGGSLRLRFEGVESAARVWLNGHWLGYFTGSRLAHELEISSVAKQGDNLLVVRVNQFSSGTYLEDQDQWWLPGIFRDVSIRHIPVGGIVDAWVRTEVEEDGRGTLSCEVRVLADSNQAPDTVRVAIDELGLSADCIPHEESDPSLGTPVAPTSPALEKTVTYRSEPVDVGPVEAWEPDNPRLYEVTVNSSAGRRLIRAGFTRIQIVDGQLRANGIPLKLNGVNRHEIRADAGRVFDEAFVREDLATMKAFGINAIRTCHYPPHPRVLDLADELGLWVMLECDLETHGFEYSGQAEWSQNPSSDLRWRPALMDRIERTFERDKNHPSIVIWSLGNESGSGENLAAMSAWVKQRDRRAVVHYESDRAMEYTDIYSRMYPTYEEITTTLDDGGGDAPIAVPSHPAGKIDANARRKIRRCPFVVCEYAHAMGTGPGGVDRYIDLFEGRRSAGGFVWEWRDHGLWQNTDCGPRLAYGGDFGEEVHDGNFVTDGLLGSTGEVDSGLINFATVSAPVQVRIRIDNDEPVIILRARTDMDATAGMRLRWTLAPLTLCAGEDYAAMPGHTGVAQIPEHLAAGEEIRLPLGTLNEALRKARDANPRIAQAVHVMIVDDQPGLDYRLAIHTPPIDRYVPVPTGYTDSEGQRVLTQTGTILDGPNRGMALCARDEDFVEVSDDEETEGGDFGVDARGILRRLGALELDGVQLTAFRAPTDNDEGHAPPDYFGRDDLGSMGEGADRHGSSSADRWRAMRIELMRRQLRGISHDGESITVREYWGVASRQYGANITVTYTPLKPARLGKALGVASGDKDSLTGGIIVTYEVEPVGQWPEVIGRFGVRLRLPGTGWHARWAGTGPGISYPDMTHAVWPGVFSADVNDMWERHLTPQEGGNRADLRELVLTSRCGARCDGDGPDGSRLEVYADGDPALSFSLSTWTERELAAAGHWDELPEPEATYLWLDWKHHGIGTRSCGPDVRPEYQARVERATVRFIMRA